MKQSKTPMWKKSCLAGTLSFDNLVEWLDEVGENGDPYGYEDSSQSGYYLDYKELFDDLSAGAYAMSEQLCSDEYYGIGDYESFRDVWNDMTVGLLGDMYTVYGYDAAELDYFRLADGFKQDLAVEEAGKRLMRLTSIVEELDEKGALLERKNERINALYEDLTGKNAELFDNEIANLPQRMWVE